MTGHRVRLAFLTEVRPHDRIQLERAICGLRLGENQREFSLPPDEVIRRGRLDPTRCTFAVLLDLGDRELPVGVGVLQPEPATTPAMDAHRVKFRSFSIDPHWQGRGIGTTATGLAVAAVPLRYPRATTVMLTVHVDNSAGRRAYLRCGFNLTGDVLQGRAGPEHVMEHPIERPSRTTHR